MIIVWVVSAVLTNPTEHPRLGRANYLDLRKASMNHGGFTMSQAVNSEMAWRRH